MYTASLQLSIHQLMMMSLHHLITGIWTVLFVLTRGSNIFSYIDLLNMDGS